MTKKDDKLRKKIIDNLYNNDVDKLDGIIDYFVGEYDNDEWCRGWFKSQITWLVQEAYARGNKSR